jgi:hypothetical protein
MSQAGFFLAAHPDPELRPDPLNAPDPLQALGEGSPEKAVPRSRTNRDSIRCGDSQRILANISLGSRRGDIQILAIFVTADQLIVGKDLAAVGADAFLLDPGAAVLVQEVEGYDPAAGGGVHLEGDGNETELDIALRCGPHNILPKERDRNISIISICEGKERILRSWNP